ncbi:MAG: UDP binding domain-containing protein, partial [Omnitrophica WOR_2 bacterium]
DLTTLIQASRQVNDSQPQVVVTMVRQAIGDLNGHVIAVLGLAYKPDVDDLRESPAVEIARLLGENGALVRPFEPYKPDLQMEGLHAVPSLEQALAGAELIVLLVRHKLFLELNPVKVASLTPARRVVDAVNAWDVPTWQSAGFVVSRLGVRNSPASLVDE